MYYNHQVQLILFDHRAVRRWCFDPLEVKLTMNKFSYKRYALGAVLAAAIASPAQTLAEAEGLY